MAGTIENADGEERPIYAGQELHSVLKGELIHPQILGALGKAGHGSKVLISDGNYPHWTKRGQNAEVVYLGFAPGRPTVTKVLEAIVTAIPIEAAEIMDTNKTGPYVLS